jgi:hypothetical protein
MQIFYQGPIFCLLGRFFAEIRPENREKDIEQNIIIIL